MEHLNSFTTWCNHSKYLCASQWSFDTRDGLQSSRRTFSLASQPIARESTSYTSPRCEARSNQSQEYSQCVDTVPASNLLVHSFSSLAWISLYLVSQIQPDKIQGQSQSIDAVSCCATKCRVCCRSCWWHRVWSAARTCRSDFHTAFAIWGN